MPMPPEPPRPNQKLARAAKKRLVHDNDRVTSRTEGGRKKKIPPFLTKQYENMDDRVTSRVEVGRKVYKG